jgi:CHAT domain-containing protein
MCLSTGLTRGAWLAIVVSTIACAAPPHKEIDQAQGAIDAARAAGAERYAPAEFASANQALKQANDAVAGRDYRLALNYALESREEAQNAARTAADNRAKLRGNLERSIAEAEAVIEQTRARLDGPNGTQIPRGTRRTVQQRLTQLDGDLQKVDAALQAEDYTQTEQLLMGIKQRIEGMTKILPPAAPSQSPQRRK